MNKRILSVAAFAVLGVAGCIKQDGGTTTPRAGIMVNLLSPNAVSTNITLNGNMIVSNISYGSTPQFYNQVTAGATPLAVSSPLSSSVLNTTLSTEPGKFYSVFLIDSVSKMKAIAVADSVSYPGTTDSIKVRFYNFAVNAPALNLYIIDSATEWTNRAFETQSSAGSYNHFRGLKAGTYNFKIKTPDGGTTLTDTTITFEGKHIYTLFMRGFYPDTSGATKIGLGTVRHG